MEGLTIGKLAAAAGVSTDTVRFYERYGLLPPPAWTASNYRCYPSKDNRRLKFIKRTKDLGFILNEIKELLALRHDSRATKKETTPEAMRRLHEEKIKIVMLTGNSRTIAEAVADCLNLDEVIAEVLPDEKAAVARKFQDEGHLVAMSLSSVSIIVNALRLRWVKV